MATLPLEPRRSRTQPCALTTIAAESPGGALPRYSGSDAMAIPGEITGLTLASANCGRDGVIVIFDVAGASGAIEQTQTMWLPVPVARDLVEKMGLALADLE